MSQTDSGTEGSFERGAAERLTSGRGGSHPLASWSPLKLSLGLDRRGDDDGFEETIDDSLVLRSGWVTPL